MKKIDSTKIKSAIVICYSSLEYDMSIHHNIDIYYSYENELRKLDGYCDNHSIGRDFEKHLKYHVLNMFNNLHKDNNLDCKDIKVKHHIDSNIRIKATDQLETNVKRLKNII